MSDAKPIDVAAALIFKDGKLLITQRHATAHLGGLWEFPGGKREPNETFEQCLVREIREEIGVEILVGELLKQLHILIRKKTIRLKFFRCRLVQGEPKPIECAAVKWVNQSELDDYEFPAADAQLLQKLKSPRLAWA